MEEIISHLTGAAVNGGAIVVGGLLGCYVLKGIPSRYEDIIMKGMGLAVFLLGIQGALAYQEIMIVILSMVVGSVIGEWIDIDEKINRLGTWAEKCIGSQEGTFAKGLAMASILFCTGSMAIVGGMNSGLQADHEMLFAKALLDGTISVIFASTMGIGVAFSSVVVFLYEGVIALGAGAVKDYLTPAIINEMAATGSLVLVAVGYNFLVPQEQKIKAVNMIPAIFLPWLFMVIKGV